MILEQRRLREAEASYKRAIKLKPEYIEAHSNLGNILKELHRFNEAEACFNQAIGIKPDYAEAHYNLGNMLLEQEDWTKQKRVSKQWMEIRLRPRIYQFRKYSQKEVN